MRGSLLIIAVLLVIAVRADDGTVMQACPEPSPETLPVSLQASTYDRSAAFISVDMLVSGAFTGKAVDVRTADDRRRVPLPGMLELGLVELRTMVGHGAESFAVIGTGYDDDRLARRIAAWSESSSRVRIVSGGAAAWLAAKGGRVDRNRLRAGIGVPVTRVSEVANRPGWQLASLGPEAYTKLEHWLVDVSVQELTGVEAAKEFFEGVKAGDISGLLLVSNDGRQSADAAVMLSREFGHPVYYVEGGAEAFERHMSRFASINREPGVARGSCQ